MLVFLVLFVVALVIAYFVLASMAKKLITPYQLSDYSFVDGYNNKIERQTSILQNATLQVSVVIPAYNEQVWKIFSYLITQIGSHHLYAIRNAQVFER